MGGKAEGALALGPPRSPLSKVFVAREFEFGGLCQGITCKQSGRRVAKGVLDQLFSDAACCRA